VRLSFPFVDGTFQLLLRNKTEEQSLQIYV
jgi:hypothetical protein